MPGSPSAACFDPPIFLQRDTLTLDLQVAGPELKLERIYEARDALMAFGRYSGSEAAKDVPARLDRLFRG